MRRIWLAMAIGGALFGQDGAAPYLGRWDITVTQGNDTYPDWIEISRTSGGLAALIQPRSGGNYKAAGVKADGSRLEIATRNGETWDLAFQADRFTGVQKKGGTVEAQLAGVRAPELKRPEPRAWSAPEPLFNGKDLSGWEPTDPKASRWTVQNGELVNQQKGANLKTARKFQDFKLHVEYNCPDGGNSGIYLRGRYEVQIEYEPNEDALHRMGSVYSVLAPGADLPRKPGQWETFDITLVGRHVTVVRDGVKTIDADIPGITGGALDSREGDPGPFYIQGDHTGGLRFRNITVAMPKSQAKP
jgi:hypothetical protein